MKKHDRLDQVHCASEPGVLGSAIPFSKPGPQPLKVQLLAGKMQCLKSLKVEVISLVRPSGRAGNAGQAFRFLQKLSE